MPNCLADLRNVSSVGGALFIGGFAAVIVDRLASLSYRYTL